MEVPSTQGLDAIVRFTNTDKLHQKLLYLQCIPAAATSTKYDDNIDVLLPLMEELGHDEDQPEEVKLEIAAQLPALGKLSAELVLHNLVGMNQSKGLATCSAFIGAAMQARTYAKDDMFLQAEFCMTSSSHQAVNQRMEAIISYAWSIWQCIC